jgi:hypothetical protein
MRRSVDDRKMLAMSEKAGQELLRKACATVRPGWVCAALITVVLAFELVFWAAPPVEVLVTEWGSPTDLVGLRWADDALAISLSAVAGAIGGIFDWLVTEIPKAITWPIVALIALFAILRSRQALAWLLPVFWPFQSLSSARPVERGGRQAGISRRSRQRRDRASRVLDREAMFGQSGP